MPPSSAQPAIRRPIPDRARPAYREAASPAASDLSPRHRRGLARAKWSRTGTSLWPRRSRRPKQATLKRMDPDMVVRNALGLDQAAHDHSSASHAGTKGLIVANQLCHRPSSVPLHGRHQSGETLVRLSSGAESSMVRLSRFGDGRVTQLDPAAVHDAGRVRRATQKHSTGPPGLHGKTDGRGQLFQRAGHGPYRNDRRARREWGVFRPSSCGSTNRNISISPEKGCDRDHNRQHPTVVTNQELFHGNAQAHRNVGCNGRRTDERQGHRKTVTGRGSPLKDTPPETWAKPDNQVAGVHSGHVQTRSLVVSGTTG